MQKVSIIPAVVVVDNVVVAEFVISATPSAWYVGSEVVYLGGWKMSLFYDPGISRPLTFLARFVVNFATYTQVYTLLTHSLTHLFSLLCS